MTRSIHAPEDVPAAGPDEANRAFWKLFAKAWLGLWGIVLSLETVYVWDPWLAVQGSLVMIGPAAGFAIVVALQRHRLFRPNRSFLQMLVLHVVTALGYAVAAASVSWGLLILFQIETPEPISLSPWMVFANQVFFGLLLYTLLSLFLMWTESTARVQESRAMAAREAVLRSQAELKAIRAQFNPHFVFNTLHSLMLLVRAEPETAERAIEDVAELIRYASVLQRQDVDTVPLDRELTIARRYVALEKLRLDDRLRVDWEVSSGLGGQAVPAFALQSLLENAIKHGVSPREQGGRVRVSAKVEGRSLVLRVADDGLGADRDVVAGTRGRGLDLLRQRLAALYGESAELDFDTNPGAGFVVTLRLPAEAEPDASEAMVSVSGADHTGLPS